jgi:outer membrane murein-binding lipoprotein Lpp
MSGGIGGNMKLTAVVLATLLLAFGVAHAQPQERATSPAIESGSTVRSNTR